ncbi:hypothetical protein UFOVP26_52 [uncultured Caudovirales phage]|uniref:Uncharacterized protein n=1 Tax=uncultured Caudovirales phage TaxID=2100421 RepID=A0A6J5KIM8_9CAUD|nr:hypothetical protein UFOVP26_52 [uncultured Caudovirales phage]CAB4123738.1 hypothetical protein UFOVP44_45 [uncultured Caudovirales phage]CAB5219137.1 hypothetical protein UFOVP220_36 [uncultured Caudovirales phage]
MAQVDGKEVKVGEYVCFKADIEQGAVIERISGNRLTLKAPINGFEGEYIGGDSHYIVDANECWL